MIIVNSIKPVYKAVGHDRSDLLFYRKLSPQKLFKHYQQYFFFKTHIFKKDFSVG